MSDEALEPLRIVDYEQCTLNRAPTDRERALINGEDPTGPLRDGGAQIGGTRYFRCSFCRRWLRDTGLNHWRFPIDVHACQECEDMWRQREAAGEIDYLSPKTMLRLFATTVRLPEL